jgi:hypothetical protein
MNFEDDLFTTNQHYADYMKANQEQFVEVSDDSDSSGPDEDEYSIEGFGLSKTAKIDDNLPPEQGEKISGTSVGIIYADYFSKTDVDYSDPNRFTKVRNLHLSIDRTSGIFHDVIDIISSFRSNVDFDCSVIDDWESYRMTRIAQLGELCKELIFSEKIFFGDKELFRPTHRESKIDNSDESAISSAQEKSGSVGVIKRINIVEAVSKDTERDIEETKDHRFKVVNKGNFKIHTEGQTSVDKISKFSIVKSSENIDPKLPKTYIFKNPNRLKNAFCQRFKGSMNHRYEESIASILFFLPVILSIEFTQNFETFANCLNNTEDYCKTLASLEEKNSGLAKLCSLMHCDGNIRRNKYEIINFLRKS